MYGWKSAIKCTYMTAGVHEPLQLFWLNWGTAKTGWNELCMLGFVAYRFLQLFPEIIILLLVISGVRHCLQMTNRVKWDSLIKQSLRVISFFRSINELSSNTSNLSKKSQSWTGCPRLSLGMFAALLQNEHQGQRAWLFVWHLYYATHQSQRCHNKQHAKLFSTQRSLVMKR